MFKHKDKLIDKTKEEVVEKKEDDKKQSDVEPILKVENKDVSPRALHELLEKNLKWSQIIYEQNRKINRKLFWNVVAGWLRLFIILIPIVLAIIFLSPIAKDFWQKYGELLSGNNGLVDIKNGGSPSSVDQILKLLPMNPAQQEQLKQILK